MISMGRDHAGLIVHKRWFIWPFLLLVVMALCWNTLIAEAIAEGMAPGMLIGQAIFGAVMTYFVVAALVNVTRLRVTEGHIAVYHGPIPVLRSRTLRRDEIAELVIEDHVMYDEPTVYSLWAKLATGKRVRLVRRYDQRATVVAVTDAIAAMLQIRTAPALRTDRNNQPIVPGTERASLYR